VHQLPDAIQALAALLRAGHSLGQAATTLAETQPRPLRDEWRLLLRRLRMGERADAAFESLAARIDAPEARLFATTVRIAVDLGGSLAEALENLAEATRRRLEMQARIGALTSQGRLQGVIVGALPLLLMAALTAMDRGAMALLWSRPAGWAALVVLACLEICGFVMIRRIVRIDV
jgi:tight adherence protein B